MKGTDCITFRMSADVDGLKDVADQTKRVVKAARKLEKEIAKLAGMEVAVRASCLGQVPPSGEAVSPEGGLEPAPVDVDLCGVLKIQHIVENMCIKHKILCKRS